MKPSMNPKTLQAALVIVAAALVGIAEAPGIDQLIPSTYLHILQVIAAALGGSQLFRRVGDYAPSEVTLVPAERASKP